MNKFNKYTYLLLAVLGAASVVAAVVSVAILLLYNFIINL